MAENFSLINYSLLNEFYKNYIQNRIMVTKDATYVANNLCALFLFNFQALVVKCFDVSLLTIAYKKFIFLNIKQYGIVHDLKVILAYFDNCLLCHQIKH